MNLLNYLKNIVSYDCCDEGNVISALPLQRSDDYCTKYKEWLELNKYPSMLEELYKASVNHKNSPNKKDASISFLIVSKINGFTMQYDNRRWEEEDFRYLFEYIATVLIQKQGFEKCSSLKEITKYSDRIETVERYKLKSLNLDVDYSDILIRLCSMDDKIISIKFCATCTKKRITSLPNLLQKIATT